PLGFAALARGFSWLLRVAPGPSTPSLICCSFAWVAIAHKLRTAMSPEQAYAAAHLIVRQLDAQSKNTYKVLCAFHEEKRDRRTPGGRGPTGRCVRSPRGSATTGRILGRGRRPSWHGTSRTRTSGSSMV